MISSICWVPKRNDKFKERKLDDVLNVSLDKSTENVGDFEKCQNVRKLEKLKEDSLSSEKNTLSLHKELSLSEEDVTGDVNGNSVEVISDLQEDIQNKSADIYQLYNFDDYDESDGKLKEASSKEEVQQESNSNDEDDSTSISSTSEEETSFNENISDDSLGTKKAFQHDPNITSQVCSTSGSEDRYCIRENDNMIIVATLQERVGSIDFHVYDRENNDRFPHHDILLKYEPTCIDFVEHNMSTLCSELYDGSTLSNAYVAVAYNKPKIDFFDIAITDIADPVFSLGSVHRKRKLGNSNQADCHTDLITGIHWNRLKRNLLGSCSVDNSVVTWNLDKLEPDTYINYGEKCNRNIVSFQWNSLDENIFLTLNNKRTTRIHDIRNIHNPQRLLVGKIYKSNGKENPGCIETIAWNRHNQYQFITGDEVGNVTIFDIRQNKTFVKTFKAYDDDIVAIDMCYFNQHLATLNEAKELKVFDISVQEPKLLKSRKINTNNIICDFKYSPDHSGVIAYAVKSESVCIFETNPVQFEELN